MANPIDQEIEAIKSLMTVLGPLQPKARQAALDYVLRRLDIKLDLESSSDGHKTDLPPGENSQAKPSEGEMHIKTFKELKSPKSDNEMAALVAFFLQHKAQDKKDVITAKDIETQFKIAEYPLPKEPRYTLTNAKNAGYLDAAGVGLYKLNPVGYNLIVHSLPRKGGAVAHPTRRKAAAKKGQRKAK